jgi:hypothetical protein
MGRKNFNIRIKERDPKNFAPSGDPETKGARK